MIASSVVPASASVVPAFLEFGDIPYGTAGTPVQHVQVQLGGNRVKSVFQSTRFQVVGNTCGSFDTVSCTVSIAPFWPIPGGPGPGRETAMVLVTYTDSTDERIFVSGNFLPPPPTPAPSSWFSVEDATITEGNTGTRLARFTVRRSGDRSTAASVKWSTLNGTALAGNDYVGVSLTTLNFAPGQASTTVSVTVNSDTVLETDETFVVKLSSPVGAEVSEQTGDDRATGTIVDDDVPSYVSLNDVSVFEGDSGSRMATFTVTRTGSLANPVSIQWSTQDASATAGSDYVAVPRTTLAFGTNENVKTVSVEVLGDGLDEDDETILVRLTTPVDVLISDDAGTATIVDDDETYLAISDVTVNEGDPANFVVTRSGDTSAPSSVTLATLLNGTATGTDYVALAPTPLSFASGETAKTVSIPTGDDAVDEANETFVVRMTNPVGAVLSDDTGVATIVDDDGPITPGPATYLSIGDTSVVEGHGGTKVATLTVSRSGDTSSTSSVKWSTLSGSASAADDYIAVGSTDLVFATNQTSRTISVTVKGDALDEAHETFPVRLTNPVGATISDAVGVVTIIDDDATFLSINETRLVEPDTGTANATFTITRSGSLTGASSVRWGTAPGTADAGIDYVTVPPTLVNFAPGERVKVVTVPVIGDTLDEPNESFTVVLSLPSGATIADTRGTATIVDNDIPTFVAVHDLTVVEGTGGTTAAAFTVTRYGKTTAASSVKWRTGNASAAAGSDYVAVPLSDLHFAAGQTTQTVSVTVNSDTVDEDDEHIQVLLSSPVAATIADGVGIATVVDDDPTTALSVNDIIQFDEEAAGTIAAEFTITRSGDTSGPSSVTWSTADSTALGGLDYVPVSPTTVNFAAGETVKRISVTVIDDAEDEENERFLVHLTSPVNATIVDGTGEAMITDYSIDWDV